MFGCEGELWVAMPRSLHKQPYRLVACKLLSI
jgi:hypothetical protein